MFGVFDNLFVFSSLLLFGVTVPAWSQEQYRIDVSTSTNVTAGAHNVPSVTQSHASTARAAAKGNESSQCVKYGRQSSASADAKILSRVVEKNASSVHANISATANGGHFRTCNACVFGACGGIHGNDTKAQATASTTAIFTITFDSDARTVPYELTIVNPGVLSGVTNKIEVKDYTGKLLLQNATGGKVDMVGGPGKIFTVTASLSASLSNEGGCCVDTAAANALLGLRLQRAPIMDSLGIFQPRIVGGHDVLDGQFKEVGALLQDDRPNCTGTLIAEDLVLTAAHCVYERNVSLMTFALGSNAWKPDQKVPVLSYRYPKGEKGFRYDDKTLVDDVAILRLHGKLPLSGPPLLHAGLPALSDLKSANKTLTYIGYGYKLVDRSPAERGVKRFVDIPIDELQGSTFRNKVPGLNTCNGDSGGPAMFVGKADGKDQWFIAGITSGGDLACVDYGISTRVDKYRDWILTAP